MKSLRASKFRARGLYLLGALFVSSCHKTDSNWTLFIPRLGLSISSLSFSGVEGGADPADQSVTLVNSGGSKSVLAWNAVSDQPWLTVSPVSGRLNGSQAVNLTLHVDMDHQLQGWVASTSTGGAPSPRRVHTAVWAGDQMIVWGGSASPAAQYNNGGRYNPFSDTWIGTTALAGAPSARHLHDGVWTGTEMIIWGGWSTTTGYVNTGGRYSPDAWTGTTSTFGAPNPREDHTAIWTGDSMIIWGGWDGATRQNTGALYDPLLDQWVGTTAVSGAPEARLEHAAVWTGNEMVVWGGRNGPNASSSLASGGLYDAITNTWSGSTSAVGAPSARTNPSAVWTGREMIVWGGHDGIAPLDTGARFDPTTNMWIGSLPTAGAPSARFRHSAAWTGDHMIVWGGEGAGGAVNTGGVYQPPIPAIGDHTATVTVTGTGYGGAPLQETLTVTLSVSPKSLVVQPNPLLFATTQGVDPPTQIVNLRPSQPPGSPIPWTASADQPWVAVTPSFGALPTITPVPLTVSVAATAGTESWTGATDTTNAPSAREDQGAVWTGSRLILWGGENGVVFGDGALYDPASNQWTGPTSSVNAPQARTLHQCLWVGNRMLVLGGIDAALGLGAWIPDGNWYDPSTDTWSGPFSTNGILPVRIFTSAVWTGSVIIFWGGFDNATVASSVNTGIIYDPFANTVLGATSTVNAPSARHHHRAVWTGTEMIVWGGKDENQALEFADGAAYDPATDTWTSLSPVGSPAARQAHSAVWTGDTMIVWGGKVAGVGSSDSGGIYHRASDTWLGATTSIGAPAIRQSHTAVWTGDRMIVTHGAMPGNYYQSGGIYAPAFPARAVGTHQAQITFSAPGLADRTLDVELTVTP